MLIKQIFLFPVLLTITIFSSHSTACRMDQNDIEDYGLTWMWFPDVDGVPHKIDLTYDMNAPVSMMRRHLPIKLFLYTKENKFDPQPLFINDEQQLSPYYNPSIPLKVMFHGWKSNYTSPVDQLIKNGYLDETTLDVNVIAVDWSVMAADNTYFFAARDTEAVGKYVANVLERLILEKQVTLKDIHLVGHSLGAHAAGATGENMKSGKVDRISGLDPALPGFGKFRPKHLKLDSNDARFIDVIHTCAGFLAEEEGIGHVDFYPNNGRRSQPGCDYYSDIVCACSHSKAYEYFAQSITREAFMAYSCKNWDDYKAGKCNGDPVNMGENVPSTATGKYYLQL